MGWQRGFWHSDPGLAAALVVQQSARLKTEMWLLYIDLATMFPKINRKIGGMAAMVHGLSRGMRELVFLIYEESEHAECVRCQYETEVGLGASFKNWMGSLMGAFSRLRRPSLCSTPYWSRYTWWSRASGRSVTSRPTWRKRTWRQICSLAFADDWLGAMCNVTEARCAKCGRCGPIGK